VSEAVDDTVGTDWPRFWSDHEKMVELISRDSIGPEYYEIVSDVKKIEECLYNPDLRFRLLALQLCGNRWNPSAEAKLRIMELAKQDTSEIVRAVAIVQIGTPSMSSSIPEIEIRHLLRFFATTALGEAEPDLVRRAAYQSAVLCQPDYGKTRHIKAYIMTSVKIADFDLAYLRGILENAK
jgi:hypothetical protein